MVLSVQNEPIDSEPDDLGGRFERVEGRYAHGKDLGMKRLKEGGR